MSHLLNFNNWVRLNESMMINEAELLKHKDFTDAAIAFKKIHKGSWFKMENKEAKFAGTKYFITAQATPNKPGGGVIKSGADGSIMDPYSFNVYEIKANKYGVPMPFFAGSVWLSEKGTASIQSSSENINLQLFYTNVKAGWTGITKDDILEFQEAGLTGQTWTTYCTNIATTVTANTTIAGHVKSNLEKYKTQPTGFASDLWLTIKPLVAA